MNNDIGNYVKPCIRCNQNNPIRRKPAGHLKPIESPFGVRQLLSMDFHGPIIPTSRRDDNNVQVTSGDKVKKQSRLIPQLGMWNPITTTTNKRRCVKSNEVTTVIGHERAEEAEISLFLVSK
ncbi:unnamed protein product [Rotaria magnacalcarata]